MLPGKVFPPSFLGLSSARPRLLIPGQSSIRRTPFYLLIHWLFAEICVNKKIQITKMLLWQQKSVHFSVQLHSGAAHPGEVQNQRTFPCYWVLSNTFLGKKI
ncbi:hypothetical protein FKM82_026470 [Ascaphus truei]